MNKQQTVVHVDDKVSVPKSLGYGAQHFMALLSGGAIVPALIMGLSPSLALFCTGLATIIYLLVTRNKIPAYLGVSFSYISPVIMIGATEGLTAALGGIVIAGAVFIVIGLIIKLTGTGWLDRIFPPVLIGSIIAVIGIGLAPDAISYVFYNGDSAAGFNGAAFLVGIVTLAVCVIFSAFFKGFISTIPILIAIVIGYIVAVPFGFVDLSAVSEAAWFGLPSFTLATFNMNAILMIAPIAIVVCVEHIGKLLVIGGMIERDTVKLLPQSLIGTGLGTMVSGFIGGAALTPIAENIGVMGVTKVYSSKVFYYAAGFSLLAGGFCPKFAALILSIPNPVLGGVSLLLFGTIAVSGVRILVDHRVDFDSNRNTMVAAVVLIVGIGMMTSFVSIPVGDFTIPGLLFSMVLGVIINLVIPEGKSGSGKNDSDAANGGEADPKMIESNTDEVEVAQS